jgi:hypothetical protein
MRCRRGSAPQAFAHVPISNDVGFLENRMRSLSITVFCAIVAASAFAGGSPPGAKPAAKPTSALLLGEYIADGGWGWLEISAEDRDGAKFDLQSVGANFHTCGLEGRIVGGKATLETFDGEAACVVTFALRADGIAVSGTQACQSYCGARAGFDGNYLRPAPGCGSNEKRAARAEFKRLYDRKRYSEALTKLAPLTSACDRTLYRYERGEILNDIAITQYKLGRRADCLRTLEPLAEDAALSDDEIRDGYPPSDADAWLPIVKAARFNLGLCRKKSR